MTIPGLQTAGTAVSGTGAAGLTDLHNEFGDDWAITVESGRLVAVHRREGYDARRERWIVRTTVEAATPEQLHTRLTIQQAVRGAENR